MTSIAVTVDLRARFGPVRNQGPRPTCLAFAASDAHAALRDGWVALSCEYAFYHAQRRAQRTPSQGALLSSMLEALHHDGQPEESGWPYLPATPSDSASWRPPIVLGPLFGCVGEKANASLDRIVAALDQGRATIILLTLSQAFFRPSAQAVVDPVAGEMPEPQRRHAVIAVGYGSVDGKRAILVRNSWGTRWGEGGYAWLTETFLMPRLFGAATLVETFDVLGRSVTA